MTVEEQIKDFILKNLLYSNDGFPCGDNDSFLDQGIIDSMGIMQLVLFVEENFHIQIKDEEVTPANFDSVIRLADYVRNKKNTSN